MLASYYVYVWYKQDDGTPFYVGKGKGERCHKRSCRNKYFSNVIHKHGGYVIKIAERLTDSKHSKKRLKSSRSSERNFS